jgi:hypothetical protein
VRCIVNDEQSVNDVFKKMNGYEYSIDIEQFQFAHTPYNSFSTWKLSDLHFFWAFLLYNVQLLGSVWVCDFKKYDLK